MPNFLKKKQFWGSIIAVILLAYCIKDVSTTEIQILYQRLNFYYLIPAFLMQAMMIASKAIRWRTIVEKTKRLSIWKIIPLFSAGQVINIIMPALTGQVGRILLFAKKENLSKTYVFSTVVIEVLFDAISLLICIFLLSSAAIVFPPEYRSISYIIAIATVVLFILLYLFLHYKEKFDNIMRRVLRDRWPGVYITLKKFSLSFTKGIALLRSSQYFFRTLAYSLAAWVTHVLVIYFLFESFGFELPLITAVVIMVINTVALMIPITPGNAGTFELVVVAPLLAFHIPKSDAVLFALALHIIDFLPMFLMGSFYFRTEKVTIKEIDKEGEKEEILDKVDEIVVEEK
jgi:uncharacterized protein (TIRG00374 family)